MRNIILLFVIVASFSINHTDLHFRSNNGYGDRIIIKFNERVFHDYIAQLNVNIGSIINEEFLQIVNEYGEIKLRNILPNSYMRDTLIFNKRTGKFNVIPKWSQVYELFFQTPVPVRRIRDRLNKLSIVEYAEIPVLIQSTIAPNDLNITSSFNWAFEKIQAEKAWDITTGDSSITIGIIDWFGDKNENIIHEDLIGKVNKNFGKFGKHGRIVAGIAGANTNNQKGVASLGWNLKLNFYNAAYPVKAILKAIEDDVDVINFSWVVRVDDSFIRDAVKTALAKGIVCVASTGNDEWKVPDVFYPAAYNFGEIGQVIAVSATNFDGNEERFIEGWNFSPGNDPLNDPWNSFIDISAPGYNIEILNDECCTSYSTASGTSLAAPFVSALAGLLLSVDSTLTPKDIYNILTGTADKVGQFNYDRNGWNQYLGYGRINAFKSLDRITRIENLEFKDYLQLPSSIKLFQNYPNPFNGTTSIGFENNKTQQITLKVYNILGEEISTIVDGILKSGIYTYEFIPDNTKYKLASNIFIFRLKSETCTKIVKGILLK